MDDTWRSFVAGLVHRQLAASDDHLGNDSANSTESHDPSLVDDVLMGEGPGQDAEFDHTVFWCVNGFIFLIVVAMVCWCCYGDKSFLNADQRRQETDRLYQASLREREQMRQQAKVDTPEQRRRKLQKLFQKHEVQMVCKRGVEN